VTEPKPGWSEADSRSFVDIGDVAVPSRAEQLSMLLSLIPADADEEFLTADICCGEGIFAERILTRFPRSRLLALDGSPMMRERASKRLAPFGDRAEVRSLDLDRPGWVDELRGPFRCITSSLALHHLSGESKRALFCELSARIEPGGALLVADIVEPATETVRIAYRDLLNAVAKEQSLALTGTLGAFETFQKEGWNGFVQSLQPPGEMPSRLFDQLKWLEEAGFSAVDCFWLRAGTAIYGGFK